MDSCCSKDDDDTRLVVLVMDTLSVVTCLTSVFSVLLPLLVSLTEDSTV
jgi:hypothetical protein